MTRGQMRSSPLNFYQQLHAAHGWSAQDAWKEIALLLLTCDLYEGKRTGFLPFRCAVAYRESNGLFVEHDKPSGALKKAVRLTSGVGDTVRVLRRGATIGGARRRVLLRKLFDEIRQLYKKKKTAGD